MLSVRAFTGVPRLGKLAAARDDKFFGLGLTNVYLAAADASFSLSDCLDWNALSMSLEASVLYRHEKLQEVPEYAGCKANNVGWSGRLNMESDGLYFKGGFVDAGMQYINPFSKAEKGDAQLIELGYNRRGLGLSVTGRRIHRMNQQIYTGDLECSPAANVLSAIFEKRKR
jgi:hypothetical protein